MMKVIVFVFVCWLKTTNVLSQNKVVANISNLKNDKGVCRACLFNSPSSFNGETGDPFKCVVIPVKNRTASVAFENIPPGTYAMFVFHDANNNKKMDKNFIGIPKEGYGASKNKLPFASAPTFNENSFHVGDNTTISLQVKIRNL